MCYFTYKGEKHMSSCLFLFVLCIQCDVVPVWYVDENKLYQFGDGYKQKGSQSVCAVNSTKNVNNKKIKCNATSIWNIVQSSSEISAIKKINVSL